LQARALTCSAPPPAASDQLTKIVGRLPGLVATTAGFWRVTPLVALTTGNGFPMGLPFTSYFRSRIDPAFSCQAIYVEFTLSVVAAGSNASAVDVLTFDGIGVPGERCAELIIEPNVDVVQAGRTPVGLPGNTEARVVLIRNCRIRGICRGIGISLSVNSRPSRRVLEPHRASRQLASMQWILQRMLSTFAILSAGRFCPSSPLGLREAHNHRVKNVASCCCGGAG
jgi:hypothetical protein